MSYGAGSVRNTRRSEVYPTSRNLQTALAIQTFLVWQPGLFTTGHAMNDRMTPYNLHISPSLSILPASGRGIMEGNFY